MRDSTFERGAAVLGVLLVLAGPAVAGRSLLYREFNLAAVYGWREARLGLHAAPPLSSAGFEYFHKFPEAVPGRLNPDVLDLYTQWVYDPDEGELAVQFQDLWLRCTEPASGLKVRLGHFELPFGLNPVVELRGQLLQPLEMLDLGFKKDWGMAVQGEWRGFTGETAATWGTGEGLRRRRGRYLWTGRLGMPTYRDVQYGISLLYGAVARAGPTRLLPHSWRLGVDLVYLYHEPFTTCRGAATIGADARTPVGGLLLEWTQILPSQPHWGIETQVRAWRRGALPGAGATGGTTTRVESAAGVWRSLPGQLTLRLHWLHHFPYQDLGADDRLLAQLYYYGP